MNENLAKWKDAALKGKLLLRLGADRLLPEIFAFFVAASLFIGFNLIIESTVHRKEENKKILENLKSIHTELKCSLTSLDSVCKVEDMLEGMGSKVKIPAKKADIIE